MSGFVANILQFGVDQLPDASTTEVTSFVSWCAWSVIGSQFIVFLLTCFCADYWPIGLLLACVSLSLIVSSNFIFSNNLIKEPAAQNPFTLIFKVVRYAIKNKQRGRRVHLLTMKTIFLLGFSLVNTNMVDHSQLNKLKM